MGGMAFMPEGAGTGYRKYRVKHIVGKGKVGVPPSLT